jgi:hypothetical protein
LLDTTLGRQGIINSFWLRMPGNDAKDRVKSSAGLLTCLPTAWPDRRRSSLTIAYFLVAVKKNY